MGQPVRRLWCELVASAVLLHGGIAVADTGVEASDEIAHKPNRSVVVLDVGVDDQQSLLSGVRASRVIRLDSRDRPLTTLAARLRQLAGPVDELHIVSHGSAGGISLGGQWLDAVELASRRPALEALGASLSNRATINLYGCDVAASGAGRRFVDTFASVTGASVAGSDDLTGYAALGGDWQLEYRAGERVARLPFDAQALDDFRQTLSHFRGGSIGWQSKALDGDGVRNDVELTVKTAWRWNWSSLPVSITLQSDQADFSAVKQDDELIYVNGDATNGADYALQTTRFIARDLELSKKYLAYFTGSARIDNLENNANGTWKIQTLINLAQGNLAPKIDVPIILEVPQLQSDGTTTLQDYTYQLSSRDPNADKLRFRLANLDELGGGSQTNPAGLAINPNTGVITWTNSGTRTSGFYSAGIIAEDLDEAGSVKSKTHVDLILTLKNAAQTDFSTTNVPETRNIIVEKGETRKLSITGTAIDTQSLGSIQSALTETAADTYEFSPGPSGSGLDPGTYPITFEVRATGQTNNYLGINFIVPDPDAPRIADLEADRVTYTGVGPVNLDENKDLSVSDIDTSDFMGGMLKANVTFTDGQFEVLGIRSVGDGTGEIRVDGADILYEGSQIGRIDDTFDGQGTALEIQFTNSTSVDALQALTRNITYEDRFVLRTEGDRNVSTFVRDPEGNSNSYDSFVFVNRDPKADDQSGTPLLSANEITLVEGDVLALSSENINFADPEEDPIGLTVSNVTHGRFALASDSGTPITSFTQRDIDLGRIVFVHDGSEVAPTYEVAANDGNGNSTGPRTGEINFTNVADQPPSIDNAPGTSVSEGQTYAYTPLVSDGDAGDTATFDIAGQPSWAVFDTATGALNGIPGAADVGTVSGVKITVSDSGGNTDTTGPFSIAVSAAADSDGDGTPDYQEVADGTDPNTAGDALDTDGDGVPDYVEVNTDGTDASDATDFLDSDGDGTPDYRERADGTDSGDASDFADSDGDGAPDYQERLAGTDAGDATDFPDTDGDGVPDYVEVNTDGTDASDATDFLDSDGDGTPDYRERADGTDSGDASDFADSDGDGAPDYQERLAGTDAGDATDFPDTDGDGVPDYVEVNTDGTDASDATDFLDSDGDGVPDYVEVNLDETDPTDRSNVLDSDGDGAPDYQERLAGTDAGDATDFPDTDGDGVPDYVEVNTDGTDASDATDFLDSDGDGTPDYRERADGTDSGDASDFADSDGDGVPDFREIANGTDPDDAGDFPDRDGDGVPDYVEINVEGTNPDEPSDFLDSDADAIPDYVEVNVDGTDPNNANDFTDTDDDGIADYTEGDAGTDTDGDNVPDYLDDDSDGDGVSDSRESAADNPDGGKGDGNGDGTADRLQPTVTSLAAARGSAQATLETGSGRISRAAALPTPAAGALPPGTTFPFGQFAVTLADLTAGETVTVSVYLPGDSGINSYWKRNARGRWYDVLSSTTQVGNRLRVDITLTEGGSFDTDADPTTLTDPGAPGIQTAAGRAGATSVPTLNEVGQWILALLLALVAGVWFSRRTDSV